MKKVLKIGDFLLILAILICSFVIFFISKNKLKDYNFTGKKYASIQVNGKEIKKVEISKNNEGYKYSVDTEYGHNLLEFTENGVKSIEASCPDQIDVKQGLITKPGEIIVCLPNRLVVEIISESNNDVNEIDVVN